MKKETEHDPQSGDWQDLSTWSQAPRYAAIAEMITKHCGTCGMVLDVGCGTAELLSHSPFVDYTGIEPSYHAANIAKTRSGRVLIHCTNAADFNAPLRYDCVVFNESLYYCEDPLAMLEKYSRLQKPDGMMIVSIFQKPSAYWLVRLARRLLGKKNINTNITTTRIVDVWMRERLKKVRMTLVKIPGCELVWNIWTGVS